MRTLHVPNERIPADTILLAKCASDFHGNEFGMPSFNPQALALTASQAVPWIVTIIAGDIDPQSLKEAVEAQERHAADDLDRTKRAVIYTPGNHDRWCERISHCLPEMGAVHEPGSEAAKRQQDAFFRLCDDDARRTLGGEEERRPAMLYFLVECGIQIHGMETPIYGHALCERRSRGRYAAFEVDDDKLQRAEDRIPMDAVVVTHRPPYMGGDLCGTLKRVGSRRLREALHAKRAIAVVSGDLHDAGGESGLDDGMVYMSSAVHRGAYTASSIRKQRALADTRTGIKRKRVGGGYTHTAQTLRQASNLRNVFSMDATRITAIHKVEFSATNGCRGRARASCKCPGCARSNDSPRFISTAYHPPERNPKRYAAAGSGSGSGSGSDSGSSGPGPGPGSGSGSPETARASGLRL